MAPKYKPEELVALRSSASESAISLDRFKDDAVKEHVLKPSASTSGISLRASASVNSLTPSDANLRGGFLPANSENFLAPSAAGQYPPHANFNEPYSTSAVKKPSPTPSVRVRKAMRLVQEHGSPPGIRVTAGGRIVPSDLGRLPSPRFAQPAFRGGNMASRIPSHQPNYAGSLSNLPNGTVIPTADGQQYQYIDGVLRPISPNPMGYPWPYAAPNMNFFGPGNAAPFMMYPPMPMTQVQPNYTPPSFSDTIIQQAKQLHDGDLQNQLEFIKDAYTKKLDEEKQALRQEVMEDHHGLLDQARKAYWVQVKVNFRTEIDAIRKTIKDLEARIHEQNEATTNNGAAQPYQASQQPVPAFPPGALFPPFAAPNFAHPNFNAYLGQAITTTGATAVQMPPNVQTFTGPKLAIPASRGKASPQSQSEGRDRVNGEKSNTQSPTDTVSRKRRPHAIEIKDPSKSNNSIGVQPKKSILNPTSPTYQPGKPFITDNIPPPTFVPPEPSPIPSPELNEAVQAQSPWLFEKNGVDGSQTSSKTDSSSKHDRSSVSTTATADFFPYNTQEHSSRHIVQHRVEVTRDVSVSQDIRSGTTTVPATPQKPWYGTGINSQVSSPLSEDSYMLPVPNVSPVEKRSTSRGYQAPQQSSTGSRKTSFDVDRETELMAKGKSAAYASGYVAALNGKAPDHQKYKENALREDFLKGYCEGLMSTASPKSQTADRAHDNSPQQSRESKFPSPREVRESQELAGIAPSVWNDKPSFIARTSFDQQRASMQAVRQDSAATQASVSFPTEMLPSYSGNQIQQVGASRYFSGSKIYASPESDRKISTRLSPPQQRDRAYYGSYDGAADDLAELDPIQMEPTSPVKETHLEANTSTTHTNTYYFVEPSSTMAHQGSPSKSHSNSDYFATATEGSASPSKSGSPSKKSLGSPRGKLERIASKVRKPILKTDYEEKILDDPATMTEDQKRVWKNEWRRRFRHLKRTETREIEKYNANNPVDD